MSDQNESAPAPCAQHRETIPLLAVGALDRDHAESLEKHMAVCAGCQASYRAHCKILEAVKREVEPDRPLDTERVLACLRERIGEASGGGSGAGKERPVALIVAITAISLGVLALLIFARPQTPVDPVDKPGAPDAAIVYSEQAPAGREIKSGESFKAGASSARFRIGEVEVRLKADGELRVKEGGIELLRGTVAVSTPSGKAFEVSVPGAGARIEVKSKARFVVALEAGTARITVAEGALGVVHAGGQTSLAARQRASVGTTGLAGDPEDVDPRVAFAWLKGELYAGLKLQLIVLRPARVVVSLRNTADTPISVTGYHPLGVNYQLEIRRPGTSSPEFVKLAPSALRLERSPGIVESVRETMGQLVLDPEQTFKLEMDLGPLLTEPGSYRVAAEYLGFGPSGGTAAELGLLLRSNEVRIIIPSGPSGKIPR